MAASVSSPEALLLEGRFRHRPLRPLALVPRLLLWGLVIGFGAVGVIGLIHTLFPPPVLHYYPQPFPGPFP